MRPGSVGPSTPGRSSPSFPQRGLGCSIWDVEGNEYLDMMSGQLCVSVGHSHPRLLDAVTRQSALLMQTGSSFTTPQEVDLSKRLSELTPGDLQKPLLRLHGLRLRGDRHPNSTLRHGASGANIPIRKLSRPLTCRMERHGPRLPSGPPRIRPWPAWRHISPHTQTPTAAASVHGRTDALWFASTIP